MINKKKETSAIGGIPRNCFKRLAKVGLTKAANRINLIRECTQFCTIRIEVFVTNNDNQVNKVYLLFVDESNDYLAFSTFRSLLEYVMLNYTL